MLRQGNGLKWLVDSEKRVRKNSIRRFTGVLWPEQRGGD